MADLAWSAAHGAGPFYASRLLITDIRRIVFVSNKESEGYEH